MYQTFRIVTHRREIWREGGGLFLLSNLYIYNLLGCLKNMHILLLQHNDAKSFLLCLHFF